MLDGNELIKIGFKGTKSLGIALRIVKESFINHTDDEVLAMLKNLIEHPEDYMNNEILYPIVSELEREKQTTNLAITLKPHPKAYAIFGSEHIEDGAKKQMNIAMKLPVTVSGALMPDAHQGYGLPIGGVLATRNAIIPYGVGVDIGCRMALSIYDISPLYFEENEAKFKRELIAQTQFGAGAGFVSKHRREHAVLENVLFEDNSFIKNLKDKAWSQLGSSGGGNHFVEFGYIDFLEEDKGLEVLKGRYLALLTHSGSRGFGATIAGHYTRMAKEVCVLPEEAKHLAYLDMSTELGQEYWLAMNLAGDYASACHEIIHKKIAKAIGAQVLATVENHHNFAWKEVHDGEELIVHRKGATPAGEGVLGIIPGSMTAPGFLVRGKGNPTSLRSASHGAGRQMSRTQAIKSLNRNDLSRILKDHGVNLIGAGLDEAPMAYKDIYTVMDSQKELVDVIAKFIPKLVRMADDGSRED